MFSKGRGTNVQYGEGDKCSVRGGGQMFSKGMGTNLQ